VWVLNSNFSIFVYTLCRSIDTLVINDEIVGSENRLKPKTVCGDSTGSRADEPIDRPRSAYNPCRRLKRRVSSANVLYRVFNNMFKVCRGPQTV
jgi:hypothetical protein